METETMLKCRSERRPRPTPVAGGAEEQTGKNKNYSNSVFMDVKWLWFSIASITFSIYINSLLVNIALVVALRRELWVCRRRELGAVRFCVAFVPLSTVRPASRRRTKHAPPTPAERNRIVKRCFSIFSIHINWFLPSNLLLSVPTFGK